ncbi:MAG: DUF1338 domain-containing protein [Cytophagales bacterium]|nr:MAG: DUF1338 domain-containing protein [Cytophagales bacterium]
MKSTLDLILEGLMSQYQERVPDVKKILYTMVEMQILNSISEIENDHIAFRTMGVPELGIQSLERIFLYHGYSKKDYYDFPEKKLNAYWYAPPQNHQPRIFISELRVEDLSKTAQNIIYKYTNQVKIDPTLDLNLDSSEDTVNFLHSGLWEIPTLNDFQTLATESEYAAWVIYNRYYLNHFTISVHNLKSDYNTVEKFNSFLESIGIKLNNSGGKIKKSPDGLLLQSSTVAQTIEAVFAGGVTHKISGSYVEFAERKVLPQYKDMQLSSVERIHRREGFEAQNADKIFESTYSNQTGIMNM